MQIDLLKKPENSRGSSPKHAIFKDNCENKNPKISENFQKKWGEGIPKYNLFALYHLGMVPGDRVSKAGRQGWIFMFLGAVLGVVSESMLIPN